MNMKFSELQGAALDLGLAASPPLLRANLLELLLQSAKRTPRSTAIAEMDDMFCGKIPFSPKLPHAATFRRGSFAGSPAT